MKKLLLSFFTLLLFAAATTVTAQPKKLAVFVVGMDDWMLADVVAHLAGEELNRDRSYQVVTRSGAVQQKLKALRRAGGSLDVCDLREWSGVHGVQVLYLITTENNQEFSAQLLDLSSNQQLCSESILKGGLGAGAVELKQLAWTLTGGLRSGSGCTFICSSYTEQLIGMEMVYVEGDTSFMMGCLNGRDNKNGGTCGGTEKPLAYPVLVGSFWIGKYEVTQAQWKAVMGSTIEQQCDKYNNQYSRSDSLHGVGDDYPMYYVSWYEAQAFCDTLSARTGRSYRLATEAEWEFAARGGKSSSNIYSSGNTDIVAWCNVSASHEVGGKIGNELDIYDMIGNVWEWCGSAYASYPSSQQTEIAPVTDGSNRVVRGNGWLSMAYPCLIVIRAQNNPSSRNPSVGFRVV
jgi:formylglycine-generating enzyme required for sulfatase activity